jgi:hypothetical protein
MATVVTLHEADTDDVGANNPYSTGSFSPTGDTLQLLCVTVRFNNDNQVPPTITGFSLTWTEISVEHHDTGGTESRMYIFRAVTGSSPGSGSITIDCPNDPVGVLWQWAEVTEVDQTTDQGVVQYAQDSTPSGDSTITSTFGSTPATDGIVFSFGSIQQSVERTHTPDSGYTELAENDVSENEQNVTQYKIAGSPGTTVTSEWSGSGPIGIVSVELAPADGNLGISVYNGASWDTGTLKVRGDTTQPDITYAANIDDLDPPASVMTTAFNVGTGLNRALLVAAESWDGGSNDPETPTCTYDSVSMTQFGTRRYGDSRITFFGLGNPSSGTNNIVLTWSETQSDANMTAVSYTGVDQTTPFDTGGVQIDDSTGGVSVDVTSETGDLVVDAVGWYEETETIGSGQTERAFRDGASAYDSIKQGEEDGASTVTMSHTFSPSVFNHCVIAVNMNQAPAAATWNTGILKAYNGSAWVP